MLILVNNQIESKYYEPIHHVLVGFRCFLSADTSDNEETAYPAYNVKREAHKVGHRAEGADSDPIDRPGTMRDELVAQDILHKEITAIVKGIRRYW